ncbi:MAG: tRNA pseudouridine(13) synthase TruD [Planctomycetota bacterium]|jgi:tRNA pseudouridine13 synthase
MVLKPTRPVRHPDLPAAAVEGVHKQEAADFVVEEVPLYEPSGDGTHLWLWIEKTGIATMPAAELLAGAFGVPVRQLGWAGLKDAMAVTRQWISVENGDPARARALDIEGIRVLDARRHGNKLKLGHLRGNRFEIVVRGDGLAEALPAVEANLAWLVAHGVPNWVGEQRFGKRGANLDKGLSILRGNPRHTARRVPKRLLRLLISAVQSEVFNQVLAARLESFDRVVEGDVAWLHRNGACFVVEDLEADQPRCAAFEISPSGPLPGPKCLAPRGEQGRLEAEALDAIGLVPEAFGALPGGTNDGARRPLRVPLTEASVEAVDGGLCLRFALPQGSFATSVLRELLVEMPWFG